MSEVKISPIDEYIASQSEIMQGYLRQVCDCLRRTLPDAVEKISYGMPTFWKKHNIIHFAANKNHLGIYPGPEAIVHFEKQLAGYKTSKGAIQIPYKEPLPLDLIADLAKWSYARLSERK